MLFGYEECLACLIFFQKEENLSPGALSPGAPAMLNTLKKESVSVPPTDVGCLLWHHEGPWHGLFLVPAGGGLIYSFPQTPLLQGPLLFAESLHYSERAQGLLLASEEGHFG